MTTQLAVRLPDELVRRMDDLVPGVHPTRSDAVRRAIELYLYRLDCEEDARRYGQQPLKDSELALADDPDAWSATPAW
jgi:Arc/MetJ-type ribon-helix-helix transcriptional regulator